MNANSVVLLRGLLERSSAGAGKSLTDSVHQTFWVAEQYLKHVGMSSQELLQGVVDGEKDCGFDGIYVLANGLCVSDDTPLSLLGKRPRLDIVIIQVKDSTGFREDAIDKLIVSFPRLFQLDRDEESLVHFANGKLIEISRRFLTALKDTEMPEVSVYVLFASLKATDVHPNVRLKAKRLAEVCRATLGTCDAEVQFWAAKELYESACEPRASFHSLQLAENPISTDMSGGYIGVVRLGDCERFITTSNGELDASLFEANVRDYEGETPVNRSIEDTLADSSDDVDFWWLNNGVTIVANSVQLNGKALHLESPQVVNGLQTSTEIYKRIHAAPASRDRRSLLVKVIEAKETATRERIIRATNSQTSFGLSALRATDLVQRQIEDYLAQKGLYYERRRRYYFNQGKPVDKIVSIDLMGQALVAILVRLPHVSRATPSRIFDPDHYDFVFAPEHRVQMYASVIHILMACDRYLNRIKVPTPEDFRFHVSMVTAALWLRKDKPNVEDVASLEGKQVPESTIAQAYGAVQKVFDAEGSRRKIFVLDLLAKDANVTEKLAAEAQRVLRTTRR